MIDEDAELRAAKALHRKIQSARRRSSLVSTLVGLVLGLVIAVSGQGFLADHLGGRVGNLAVVVLFFAPLLAALKLAEIIADGIVKQKISGWISALAKEHGVSEATLDEHARIAGAER